MADTSSTASRYSTRWPPALPDHEAGRAHLLEVLGGVRDRDARGAGEGLDAAGPLPEQVEEPQPHGARERLPDAGDLAVVRRGGGRGLETHRFNGTLERLPAHLAIRRANGEDPVG